MKINPIRHLGMHKRSHQYWLDQLSHSKYLKEQIDCYNDGPLVEKLENKVASLLGKQKALFFHKGTIAQLTALKVVADHKNNNKIILHPKSHIAYDENDAYKHVTHLEALLIGKTDTPFSASELRTISQSVSSLVVELPLRRIGFKITAWNELTEMKQWCEAKETHFHLDGARLWESAYFYKKPLTEISSLFNSVYVSLYKGIGAIGGSVLAGDEEFISRCKIWRHRLGGDAWTQFPSLISALDGLDNTLPQIDSWVIRAHEIATDLQKIKNIKVETPHTNGFLIYINGDLDQLNNKANQLNQEFGLKLFKSFFKTEKENIIAAEIQVGKDSESISNSEICNYFERLTND